VTGDEGIRIFHRGHDAPNSRGNDGISAWAGPSEVATWLEIQIERGTEGFRAGALERNSLGVLETVVSVESFADDFSIFHNYGADARIRMREREPAIR